MKILAVIPARGGSKGIIKKNLRILGGRPLIYHQITNAVNSKYTMDIIVSSENDEILEYASKFPIYIRKRPENLADDITTLDPVIYDATKYLENKLQKKYDIIVTLQPTSPLLKSKSIDDVLDKISTENVDTYISVADATHLHWKEKNNSMGPDYKKRLNRQWLPKMYKETGGFLITRREFLSENSRFGKIVKPYILDESECIDIDTPLDWIVCETLLKRVNILFVANGNEKIGMGHIYRTLTLADQLIGHEITFITTASNSAALDLISNRNYKVVTTCEDDLFECIKKTNCNIIINDILDTNSEYIRKLKNEGLFVVNFEDLGAGSDDSDMVFNALYEKTNPPNNHRYGYEYECLNDNFYRYDPIEFKEKCETLFVSFGGVDINNMAGRIANLVPKILQNSDIKNIIFVIGPGYCHKEEITKKIDSLKNPNIKIYSNVKNMAKLMSSTDLAITSNGRTVYELTSLGIPLISISQNDRETLHLFSRYHRGISYLGIACTISDEILLDNILELANNVTLRKNRYDEQIIASKTIKKGIDKIISEIKSKYETWKNEKI